MMKIVGHKIPVNSIENALPLYQEGLGFIVVFESEEYGWASLQIDGIELDLYVPGKGGGNRKPAGSIDFSFQVSNLQELQKHLMQLGYDVGEIVTTNDGITIFELRDVDGNELVFRETLS